MTSRSLTLGRELLRSGMQIIERKRSGGGGGAGTGCTVAAIEHRKLRFFTEASAIHNVVDWSSKTIAEVTRIFGLADFSAAPEFLRVAGCNLCEVEKRLAAMRQRLLRMASENDDLRRGHKSPTKIVGMRALQLRQVCIDFVEAVRDLKSARRKQLEGLEKSMRPVISGPEASPTPEDTDEAVVLEDNSTDMDSALSRDGANSVELRLELQSLKERGAEIWRLNESITLLDRMLSDVGTLVDRQHLAIDDPVSQRDEIAVDVMATAEELPCECNF